MAQGPGVETPRALVFFAVFPHSDMLCLSYLVGWNGGQAPRALTLNKEQKTSHQRKGKDTMSNYRMQMPAQYTSIGDDERVFALRRRDHGMADVSGHWPGAELCGPYLLGGQLHRQQCGHHRQLFQ